MAMLALLLTGATAPLHAEDEDDEAAPVELFDLAVESGAAPGAERAQEARIAEEPPAPPIRIGGALRFNFFFRGDRAEAPTKRGESGFDLFRLNLEGEYRDVLFSADYRFHSFMDTLHHGWLGYELPDESRVKLGVHKVPFGLLPFAAHNYWLGVPFYTGFSDNYDLGIKYVRDDGPWNTQFAFYKNEPLGDATDTGRYAFDLVRSGDQQNEDINRTNVRIAHTFGAGTLCENELGVSGQHGQLFNEETSRRGNHWAAATHLDTRCGRWNLQLQGARYQYNPENPPGVSDDIIRLGGFAGTHDIAAEGTLMVANLAYNFDPPWPRLDQVICYSNYSRLFKEPDGFRDSQINTTGCAVGMGPLFAFVDLILANNMVFFGDGSLADGDDDTWRARFNINVGYYW